ncbi:MAG: WHG domain-containing protein [Rubrobacter sp.]|nr:WHG domain-containing protein [Rubrobacter sp.]
MSPRAGLDRAVVVEAAAVLADEEGFEDLSLARLAERLGVRKPSLYNHVAGIGGIRRELVLKGLRELRRVLSSASAGEDGEAGIFALAESYRAFVKEHPGLYTATVMSYRSYAPDDHELGAAESEALQTVLSVLASCGIRDEGAVHAARGLRAVAHGFATLEAAGGFGMPADVDESFHRLVRAFVAGLRSEEADKGR